MDLLNQRSEVSVCFSSSSSSSSSSNNSRGGGDCGGGSMLVVVVMLVCNSGVYRCESAARFLCLFY
jgi:hypothetical protein